MPRAGRQDRARQGFLGLSPGGGAGRAPAYRLAYDASVAIKASGQGPIRILVGSFGGLILLGTALLKLPFATPPDAPISWLDSLFTATSAVCVTGLVVRDTGAGFTPFGQGVILSLIQLGGLGVMSFWLLIFWLLRGRVSLAFRTVFEHTVSSMVGARFAPVLRLIFLFALTAEAVGAALLAVRFVPEMGLARGLWHSVFHSVSAFCNAGFALYPDSLVRYADDPLVIAVVMMLIVLGGLGFFTVFDLVSWFGHRRRPASASGRSGGTRPRGKYRLAVHTRISLLVSAALIVVGAVLFWLIEAPSSLREEGRWAQVGASLFQSITTRTAGFNSVDLTALAPLTLFLMMMLMFVGGSSGSTAGGVKVTTLGVLFLTALARLRGHRNVNVFGRTLSASTTNAALTVAAAGALSVVLGLFFLLLAEAPSRVVEQNHAVFVEYFFETVSALGTVGLSLGLTPELTPAGRVVVVVMMFLGRLGPLTVVAALAVDRPADDWRHPEEEVMVG